MIEYDQIIFKSDKGANVELPKSLAIMLIS